MSAKLFLCLGRFPFARSDRPKFEKNWFWPVLNGKVELARAYIFPATTLQIPALWPTGAGELSGSEAILVRASSENSFVPFKNWLVRPARPNKWKVCFGTISWTSMGHSRGFPVHSMKSMNDCNRFLCSGSSFTRLNRKKMKTIVQIISSKQLWQTREIISFGLP